MYKFTSDGRSLATGTSWKAGDTVSPGFPLIDDLLSSGAIVEVTTDAQKGTSKPNSGETVDYTDMTVTELTDILRERELTIRGNKQEKIDRLLEDDKGGIE